MYEQIWNVLQEAIAVFNDPLTQVNVLFSIIEKNGYSTQFNQIETSDFTQSVIRRLCLITIGQTIPNCEFTSSNDADALKDKITNAFDAELLQITDTTLFSYLNNLLSEIQNDLTTRGYALPDLITYTTKSNLPACVVCQDYYQDSTRDDEIILRNVPVHPLFMSETLEILSQ